MGSEYVPTTVQTTPTAVPQGKYRGKKRDRMQLTQMQQALYEMALATPVEPHIRASCARAWSDLQERKRVLDGKPLPGQLRPDMPDKYRRTRSGSTKPVTLLSSLPADAPPADNAQG